MKNGRKKWSKCFWIIFCKVKNRIGTRNSYHEIQSETIEPKSEKNLKDQIDKLLEQGVIEPANCP